MVVNRKITDEQILQGIAEGLTRAEIADKYNVHVENLARRMRKLGVHAVHAIPEQCKPRTMGQWHYISSVDEKIKRDHPDFDYIESRRKSKNSGSEHKVKCKRCGQVSIKFKITRNFFCTHCIEDRREEKKKLKADTYAKQLAMEAEKPKVCKECGGVFYSQYADSVYCSSYCKRKAKRERQKERNPEAYKQKKRKYKGYDHGKYIERAKKYGCAYEYGVTRKKVIERDGRKCMICGKTCDESDKSWGSFGPDYPTLDHIVPLSKGGAHSWDNVQCACGECNVKKGAEQITV